nr:MFS transporter [uncultured Porphyromonas sp.]
MEQVQSQAKVLLRDKPAARWGALVILSLTMFFAYMFVDVLSPVKTMVETELGWDSTVFGLYGGSEFFLNVFVGFLILAGIILDRMGVRFTALLSGSLMVIGALLKVYALSATFKNGGLGYEAMNSFSGFLKDLAGWNLPPTALCASLGFMLFGCGTEMAGVTVSRAIVKWFKGKEMALAMGIEMAVARFGVFSIFRLSPKIAAEWGSVQAPVIFCAALLCIGLLLYIVYGFMDKALDKELDGEESEEEEPFKFSDLKLVFGKGIFWVVALLCVLYYSAIFPFQKFATEMLNAKVGLSLEEAANLFSYFPIGAMIITPFLGFFLDRKGKGATMLIAGSVLMVACHLIFAIYPFEVGSSSSSTVAFLAIVLLGISFSLVPATLWPSVPKLIDSKVLGSAYSAIFWIQNVGLMSVPVVIGGVLDSVNKDIPAGQPKDYTLAMLIFASFGVVAFVLSAFLKAVDSKKGYGLELPNVTESK